MRALAVVSLVLVLPLGAAHLAAARPFEVPTFAIDPTSDVSDTSVAVGSDGTMVMAWRTGSAIRAQLHSQAGVALADPVTIATGTQPRLAADTRGGYVVGYVRDDAGPRHLYGQRLDGAGQPVGAEVAVDQLPLENIGLHEVLGLPTGFAFVWQQATNCWLRRYDPAGVPLADAFLVGDNGRAPDEAGFPMAATALDDGGIAVLWHDPSIHTLIGRTFDGDGALRSGPTVLPAFDVQSMAPTAGGGFAAAGTLLSSTLRVVAYDASLNVVVTRDIEVLPSGDTPRSNFARDAMGRWMLVFATERYNADRTQVQEYLLPRARPLDVDLTPLEPSFPLDDEAARSVVTALLPSGSFVNAWATTGTPESPRGYANVVSLCTADVHVCGDGVFDPRCEECDDGASNNDTAADACRTSCLLPACGDGVTDSGEDCDDGTASPCDGCDASCRPVAGLACGDGILVEGCADQCDDGNAVLGDGCAPTCTLERVPGGGARATDCLAEWLVVNPTNAPLVDRRGRMRRMQRCVDDDPACDFDGGTPNACTFHVSVCANNTDVPGCVAAPLASWQLARPSSTQALRRPALAAARAAFAGVAASVTGTANADVCSTPVDVVVPVRNTASGTRAGRLALAGVATTADGARDKDGLRLICLPR